MVNLQISCLGLPSFVILTVTLQLINFLAVLKGRGTDTLNANCQGSTSALGRKKNGCSCLGLWVGFPFLVHRNRFGVEVFGRVGFWDVLQSVLETREGLLLVPGEF